MDYKALMDHLVNHLDRAMEQEGIDGDTRDRVIEKLYDAPDPETEPMAGRLYHWPPMNGSGL